MALLCCRASILVSLKLSSHPIDFKPWYCQGRHPSMHCCCTTADPQCPTEDVKRSSGSLQPRTRQRLVAVSSPAWAPRAPADLSRLVSLRHPWAPAPRLVCLGCHDKHYSLGGLNNGNVFSGYLWTLRQHWELMSEEGTFRKMTSSALAADMYYCLWWKCFGQNNSQVT